MNNLLSKIVLMILGGLLLFSGQVYSAELGKAQTYTGQTGSSLTMARYGKKADNTYLIVFRNFDDEWDNKVILHHRVKAATNTKYVIKYKKGLGKRSYNTVVDSGQKTLIKGTIIPMISVYLKSGDRNKPYKLSLAPKAAETPEALLTIYNKNKFVPKFK